MMITLGKKIKKHKKEKKNTIEVHYFVVRWWIIKSIFFLVFFNIIILKMPPQLYFVPLEICEKLNNVFYYFVLELWYYLNFYQFISIYIYIYTWYSRTTGKRDGCKLVDKKMAICSLSSPCHSRRGLNCYHIITSTYKWCKSID
jgi:hypothetical protein